MPDSPLIISIPYREPVTAFAPLANEPMAMLLDSALPGAHGRFSYIVARPFRIIRATPHPWTVRVDSRTVSGHPFEILAKEMAHFRSAPKNAPVPFTGGAVGFFSYELGGTLETLPQPRTAPFPYDMVVGLYDVIAAFDVIEKKAWVISSVTPDAKKAEALAEALGTESLPPASYVPKATWQADQTRAHYEGKVASIIDAIRAGDIYQANYTQRFVTQVAANTAPFDLYRRLRNLAPAPFAAFINAGENMQIMSASPERFLQVDASGTVETRPIKGTRARGATPDEDARLAQALRVSAKDRAENLMIVDLLRNDLARVCRPGSIEVPVLAELETFPAVHHLVSVVTGQLRPDAGALDLLQAAFPGGSITGAPKIHAMEIIHVLEPVARGPYCGTIAWLGFDGAMDSSIVIRTLVQQNQTVIAQAGGGIVAESDPAAEYEESLTKLKPLLAAISDAAP